MEVVCAAFAGHTSGLEEVRCSQSRSDELRRRALGVSAFRLDASICISFNSNSAVVSNLLNISSFTTRSAPHSVTRGAEWKDELSLFESALDVCPNSLKVLNNLALKLLYKETAVRAGELLDKALKLHPEYPSALFNRGLVYYILKEHELAVKSFESSLKIEGIQPKTRAYLAQSLLTIAYDMQGKGQWDGAEEVNGSESRRMSPVIVPKSSDLGSSISDNERSNESMATVL